MTHERMALTAAEVAKAVGVSRASVYREISTGHLRAVRFGGRLIVPTAALAALLDEPAEARKAAL